MIMNDDTWYVVRNTRGVTGFVGPGSKPVPLTEEEMTPLGIKPAELEIDFEEGDTVTITAGVWKDTVGVIQSINPSKQIVTINVELFGRETPVEIGFTEIKNGIFFGIDHRLWDAAMLYVTENRFGTRKQVEGKTPTIPHRRCLRWQKK